MSFRYLAKILIIGGLIFLTCTNIVQAGFGVGPTEVWSDRLRPGSHFEQTIYLLQSKPVADLKAQIEVDAPEVKDWISFEQGTEFIVPTGQQQFPVKVIVDVPEDAEFKNYRGKIWIKTSPVEEEEGMVGISLGAIVDINLTVSPEVVYGFAFRGIVIKDVEEGQSIEVIVTLRNVGNIEDGPTKIRLDVYDVYLKGILQSGEVTRIEAIKPFETKEITVKFSNKLDIGEYFAQVQIFKDKHTIGGAKQAFKVVEKTAPVYKVFSKWYSWVILVIIVLVLGIIVLVGFVWKRREKLRKWMKKRKANRLEKKRDKIEKKLTHLSK